MYASLALSKNIKNMFNPELNKDILMRINALRRHL